MATHSSLLAWRIPWTEEPDGLQSMGVTKSRAVTWLNNGRAVLIAGPERKEEGNSFQKTVRKTWVEKAMSTRKYSII